MGPRVATGAFLAGSIEVLEMVAIVVAVGTARSWRAALFGAAGGLAVLCVVVAGLGPALQHVSLQPLRLIVGALLLVFGLGWLRKGILRVSRDGWLAGMGEEDVDEDGPGDGRFDWTAFVASFKGVSLEGLEVAVIVVAFGSAAGALPSAVVGAGAAVAVIGLLGALTHRLIARIPRRALQLAVGAMLTTFGTFWAVEGTGADWPGDGWALTWLAGAYVIVSLAALRLAEGWRAERARREHIALERVRGVGVMPGLRAFTRFWVGFVIGDDWVFAVAVAVGLGASWMLVRLGEPAWWPMPAAVGAVVLLSLRRAISRGG